MCAAVFADSPGPGAVTLVHGRRAGGGRRGLLPLYPGVAMGRHSSSLGFHRGTPRAPRLLYVALTNHNSCQLLLPSGNS